MTTGAWFDPPTGRVRLTRAQRSLPAAWPWRSRRSLLTPTQQHLDRVVGELRAELARLDVAIAVVEAEEAEEGAA